jgi:hypothetical protein
MSRRRALIVWTAFVASITAMWAVVAVPTLYIQPFKPQTGTGIAVALRLREAAPAVTAALLVIAAALGLWVAAASRRWLARVAVVVLLALAAVPAWFARQNHFEWMFAPLPAAEYASVTDAAEFLTHGEIVMGVQLAGAARAFPIRQLGYHHIVNTEAGGEPIVATY